MRSPCRNIELKNAFPNNLEINYASFPYLGLPSGQQYLYNLANTSLTFPILAGGTSPRSIVTPGTINTINGIDPIDLAINEIYSLSAGASLSPVLPSQNLRNPYSLQQSLGVTHEAGTFLISASYVGNLGRRLIRVMTPYGGQLATGFNSYEPDYYPTSQLQIPFYFGQMTKVLAPNVPSRVGGSLLITPTYYASSVNSSYNAFQFELRKRYSKGIQLGSGFTWSHSIDTASDFVDSAGSYALPQDSSGGYEKGDSSFDVRLREAVYFVWDPSAYWERAHGWRLTGIGTIQTGLPFTVNTTVDVNNDGNLTDRLNSTNPAYLLVRPPGHDDPTVLQLTGPSSAASLLAQSICPAAQPSCLGPEGSVGRNTFRANGS